jgi:hypothetical protein
MKKTKKNESVEQRALYLYEGMSLADLLAQVAEAGVTDLSTVKYSHDYEGCGCHHDDGHCYCPPSYSEMRFEYSVRVK